MAGDGSVSMVGLGEGEPVLPTSLMKAEVSWMSRMRGNLSYEERILKRVQGILNKLTMSNYKLLRDQPIDSGITTPYILMSITGLIFYRALNEPKFCPLYAFLCSELLVNKSLPSFPSDVPGDTEITFNRILLNNCLSVNI
ncbi:hypothetical protein MKX03_012961 [Papaver bracteatum]|nr:hypothetical protein MKX03_012961 [Papaver bracteatum]